MKNDIHTSHSYNDDDEDDGLSLRRRSPHLGTSLGACTEGSETWRISVSDSCKGACGRGDSGTLGDTFCQGGL